MPGARRSAWEYRAVVYRFRAGRNALAIGMNQPPTAQPGLVREPSAPRILAFFACRYCHTMNTDAIAAPTRNQRMRLLTTTKPSAASARSRSIDPVSSTSSM
jgi:hypothetical protein